MWFLLSVAGHEPFRAGHAFMDRAPWLAEPDHVLRIQLGLFGWALVPISLSTPASTRVWRIESCGVHGVSALLVHNIICVVSIGRRHVAACDRNASMQIGRLPHPFRRKAVWGI